MKGIFYGNLKYEHPNFAPWQKMLSWIKRRLVQDKVDYRPHKAVSNRIRKNSTNPDKERKTYG